MDFSHTEDRRMLADTLQRYLADRYPIEERNRAAYGEAGYSPEHWRALAELGIQGAMFDEAAGGFGGAGFDLMVVFEALGRGLVVEPFLGALMAGTALARAGGQEEMVGRLIAGDAVLAFAHEEPHSRWDHYSPEATADETDGGWRVSGAKAVVQHAEAADALVVSAWTDGRPALFLIERGAPGLSIRGYPNIDGGRAGEVVMAEAAATLVTGDETAAVAAVRAAYSAGLLALSAEALGIMEVLRDQTLDYLRTRQQFGVPIGKFQALQHRMADVLIEIEQARSAVINAADAYGTAAAPRALAAAKYTVGHVGRLVAEEAIQMHGGIGMTWELPLSHFAKRLTMIDHQLGDEDTQLERYIALGREAA